MVLYGLIFWPAHGCVPEHTGIPDSPPLAGWVRGSRSLEGHSFVYQDGIWGAQAKPIASPTLFLIFFFFKFQYQSLSV